jgi:hypothetical protein
MTDPVRQLNEVFRQLREEGEESSPGPATCPPPENLERFRRGELADWEIQDLARHIIRCRECESRALRREEMKSGNPRRHLAILLVVSASVAILAGLFFFNLWKEPLSDVRLRGERNQGHERILEIVRGERIRLELHLREPVYILVILQDPGGAFSVIHPPEGGAPLLEGPLEVLPGGEEGAWDTANLDPGYYLFWILVSREPVTAGECKEMSDQMEKICNGIPLNPRDQWLRRLKEGIQEAFQPKIRQIVIRLFHLPHPLQQGK